MLRAFGSLTLGRCRYSRSVNSGLWPLLGPDRFPNESVRSASASAWPQPGPTSDPQSRDLRAWPVEGPSKDHAGATPVDVDNGLLKLWRENHESTGFCG